MHPWATTGAENHFMGTRRSKPPSAAPQFANIHQLSLQTKASNCFSPLGVEVPTQETKPQSRQVLFRNGVFTSAPYTRTLTHGNSVLRHRKHRIEVQRLIYCFSLTKELPLAFLRTQLPDVLTGCLLPQRATVLSSAWGNQTS